MPHFKFPFVALVLFCLDFTSHGQNNKNYSSIIYGEVIDTIKCNSTPSQTYALFLPKNYSPERSWPILYFFEPAARGALPLNKYRTIAEKFNFIFVCSNNSKNGSWEDIFEAADAIFTDTRERFNIDENKIYTSGFSGGSRAAVTLATKHKKISGVIGCGAGFSTNPDHRPTKSNNNFNYVGIVGNRDMNYLEQFRVAKSLNDLDISNFLITFNGKHIWPPTKDFYKAMEWLEFQKKGETSPSTEKQYLNSEYLKKRKDEIAFLNQENVLDQKRHFISIINDFKEIYDVESFEIELKRIISTKAYRKKEKENQKLISRELEEREKYLEALTTIPFNNFINNDSIQYWWKMERNSLLRLENNKDSLKSRMASRVLNLIWATCAEKGWGALKMNNFKGASEYFYLWTIIQHNNYWPYLNLASSYALQNNKKEALKMLQKATEFGSISSSSLEKIKAFQNIRQEPEYTEILSKLPRE